MKLAVILEASKDWSDFSKSVSRLEQTLRTASIEDGGTADRSDNALNFEMVNDIQHSLKRIQYQLDRLDMKYKWREHMRKKKERVFGK